MVCYDALPSLNLGQIQKMADWYQKTQKFQRAVYSGDGNLEDKVNAFFSELAKPYEFVQSGADHRHRRRQRVAVHRCSRTVGRQEEEGSVVLRNSPAPEIGLEHPLGPTLPRCRGNYFDFEDYDHARSHAYAAPDFR